MSDAKARAATQDSEPEQTNLQTAAVPQDGSSLCEALEHYDHIDVFDAFIALPDAESERLLDYAQYRVYRLRASASSFDALELFHEALTRTLRGDRKWRRGVSFFQHMVGCMRSISHHWFEQASRYVQLSEIEGAQTKSPVLPVRVDPFDAHERLELIRKSLKGNATAISVLDTMVDGLTPAEAQESLGIPANVYSAARQQIRRTARKCLGVL